MRWFVVLTIVTAGCVATLPSDPTITADLAVETARAILASRRPDAVPDDKPKPGDKCPNCEGRGYVGDGRVQVKCQPCKGTGRVQ